jgi:P2-related tail formation protein
MLRALDDASVLDRYLEIKAQLAALEEELETLKSPLLFALMDEPGQKALHRGFEISVQRRKTFAYSDKVQELEDVLKEAKAHEREAGLAEVTKDQAILVVRAVKT